MLSAWPAGAMFELGLIDLVGFCPLRADALAAEVPLAESLWAGGLLLGGLAEARPADVVRVAALALLPAVLRVSTRRSPTLWAFPLEPKAARTAANAASSES
jgi:hypothetical protein